MVCYKFDDDFLFPGGITYLEVDDGCVFRHITVGDEKYVASNLNYPQWGFTLPEGCINDYALEGFVPIAKQEFDTVWNQHLARNHHQWEVNKILYPVGGQITGAILIFYPQGVILDLGANALGVADYAQCRASAHPEWMYPKHRVEATVAGYDEENQWIKLIDPQVLAETAE